MSIRPIDFQIPIQKADDLTSYSSKYTHKINADNSEHLQTIKSMAENNQRQVVSIFKAQYSILDNKGNNRKNKRAYIIKKKSKLGDENNLEEVNNKCSHIDIKI